MFLCAVGNKSGANDVVMTEQLLDIRYNVITNIDVINEQTKREWEEEVCALLPNWRLLKRDDESYARGPHTM